jgi:hypothetical protein
MMILCMMILDMDSGNESSIFSNSKSNTPEALNIRDLAEDSETIKSSYNTIL